MTRRTMTVAAAAAALALTLAGCTSGGDDTPSYTAAPGGESATETEESGPAADGEGTAQAQTETSEQTTEAESGTDGSSEDRLAGMTEADVDDFEVTGEPLAEGTYFRNDAGTVSCLFNDYNQFCHFQTVRDYAALDGAEAMICETTLDGQMHSSDLYIGWNPSPGMGNIGSEPGLCALDGGFPVRGTSPELPAGEKIAIPMGTESDEKIVCGNDADTIICSYRGHGFTATEDAVSSW